MYNKILVINGPNINLTGIREKDIYGDSTYDILCRKIEDFAEKNDLLVEVLQTNYEGDIIDKIHKANTLADGIILNAAAFTHYSYAIRDAILAADVPVIEVHISNIFARDDFRKKSVISEVCMGQITGFGFNSYILALQAFLNIRKDS